MARSYVNRGKVRLVIPKHKADNSKTSYAQELTADEAVSLSSALLVHAAAARSHEQETTVTIGIDVEITADTKDWRWDVSGTLHHERLCEYIEDRLEIEGLPYWMEATIADIATKDVRSE